MKIRKILRGLGFVLLLTSCAEVSSDKIKQKQDVIHPIDSTQIVTNSNNNNIPKSIPIDSTKLIKAFADIYFGIPETKSVHPDSTYFDIIQGRKFWVSGFEFIVYSTNYWNNEGLYEFSLIGKRRFNSFEDLSNAIEKIQEVIQLSYNNYRNIKLVIDDGGFYSTDPWNFPLDDGDEYFLSEYNKEDIRVRLGYTISYKLDNKGNLDTSIGKYRLLFNFCRPSVQIKKNQIKEQENLQRKTNDARQF